MLQILEMDDDEEEREFSKSIVYDFFQQAEGTFGKMDTALYLNPTPSRSPMHPPETNIEDILTRSVQRFLVKKKTSTPSHH